MSIYSFKNPEMLFLLLLIPVFIWIVIKSRANISTSKKVIITLLRVAAVTLLIFCLAGFASTVKNDDLYVIYLIDYSDSYSEQNVRAAMRHIMNASKHMKENDKAAVIIFGKEAVVDIPFSDKISFFRVSSYIDKSHTNIAQAIKIAEVLFPENVQKKIVLFTDGNENAGNAIEEAKIAVSHGIEVLIHMPEDEKKVDLSVDKLILPHNVNVNEPFSARVVISGNKDSNATLRVMMDKNEILKKDVHIKAGKKSVITFEQSLQVKGAHIFDVELKSKGDVHIENNVSQGFVFVAGEQSVLYVYGGDKQSDDLIKALRVNKIKVNVVTAAELHPSISYLRNYDVVVLDNVPATSLSTHHMKSMQMYVKAIGGGLIMIGGENSFGLGGYFRTPIEKALPVEMDIKQHKKYAHAAMVVIIDKSGSMSYTEKGIQKIELANEGAINVLEMLFTSDVIGVIACDSVPKWAVELGKVGDKAATTARIASIRAGGGGIYTYSSLFEAYQKLKDLKINLKHIILFADAADAEEPVGINGEHVYSLVQRMVADNITVTTIAIGKPGDKDLDFLKETAFYGRGRFYFTSDMFTLPQIFAKEAFIASKSLVVEEEFVPVKKDFVSELSSVDLSAMPPLKGYVLTTAKKLAVVPYETNHSDPLVAMWQYGLGRAAVFTSDAKDRWAAKWIGIDGYASFWTQFVRWTFKKEESSNYNVNLKKKDNKLKISVDAVDNQGNFLNFANLKATVVDPDFNTSTISLNQTGTGRYETSGEFTKSGTYFVNISRHDGADIKETVSSGISIPYLDEYKRFDVNYKFLTHLVNVTRGSFIKDVKDIFDHTKEPAITYKIIITPLILLCIILFVLDAMIRKLTFGHEKYAGLISKVKESDKKEKSDAVRETVESPQAGTQAADIVVPVLDETPPEQESTLSMLLKVKKSAHEKDDE